MASAREEFGLLSHVDDHAAPTSSKKKLALAAVVTSGLVAAGLVFSLSFNLQNDVHRTQVETPLDGLGYRYEITAEPNALCNDGSRAVFYLRPSPRGNSDWLVYFDGGNACYSDASCQSRFITDHSKMSAQTTPAVAFFKYQIKLLLLIFLLGYLGTFGWGKSP